MDGKFVPMKHELASVGIIHNPTSTNEYVPKIERHIRVIKERVSATRRTLSFKGPPRGNRCVQSVKYIFHFISYQDAARGFSIRLAY